MNQLSTKVATHYLLLNDGREWNITQDMYTQLHPIYMNKHKEWSVPIDIAGSLFSSGDMKIMDSIESIRKRENKGRVTTDDFKKYDKIIEEEEKKPLTRNEKDLLHINNCKADCVLIKKLYALCPRVFVGHPPLHGLPKNKAKQIIEDYKKRQEEADDSWNSSFKDLARKYKDDFYNKDYWFLKESGRFDDNLKIEYPTVKRADVTGENREETNENIQVMDYEEVKNLFKE